jgi:D-alanyl-D-alanine carboxypeptidase
MKKKNIAWIYTLIISGCVLILNLSCKSDNIISSTQQIANQLLIDKMKFVTDSIVQNSRVPGIVALVVDNVRGIDWLYTSGVSNIPANLPMNGSYTFRIGSNTKTMTGTVLLQLVDEGKLALNDKLSKYFPAFPKSDSITIAMLCKMTSGIFNYTDDVDFWNTITVSNPSKVWLPQELLDVGFSHNFNFPPGTGWSYSNTNTIILGMIIEKLTGNTLQSEINNRIIQPLQLSNTGFLTSGRDLPGTHGRGYYSGEYEENNDMTEVMDVSWGWAAGSAYSVPRELRKYAERLVGGGFLSDSLQQKRLNDMQAITPDINYGLCLARRGSFYGHNGGMPGFTSTMYHSNNKNCTVIIYFNCDLVAPVPIVPDMLFMRFMNILYGIDY